MYKRILVTLDESELSEQALPHAITLASEFKASVHLLSVVRLIPPPVTPGSIAPAPIPIDLEADMQRARDYLAGIARRFGEEGIDTDFEVRQGDITEEILAYAKEQDVSLIIMSTHGRSGLGRWVYGSVADKVLRHAEVPVLLVRAGAEH